MADKAKFAYGSLKNLESAISSGAVDAFDLLCLYDDGVARIGWVDRNGVPQIVSVPEDDVLLVDALPETGKLGIIYIMGEVAYLWTGTQFLVISESTDLTETKDKLAALEAALEEKVAEVASKLEESVATIGAEVDKKADAEQVAEDIEQAKSDAITSANAYTDELEEEVAAKYISKKYEITSIPVGTLVDYREKEIRVMCPVGTQFTKQTVGATGNANMYYMGFKAYAPEGAVSFKEGDHGVIVDEMFDFSGDFAGTDKYGRNYSIVWLALASYDAASNTWSYFGKNSSAEKYIGWDYVVEWYNADGIVIASDKIRINLSNEECHSLIEPSYIGNITKEMKSYTDQQIEAKITEVSEIPVVEF